jgi:hypothetical protein
MSEELRAEEVKGAVSKWYSNKGERERERAAATGDFIYRFFKKSCGTRNMHNIEIDDSKLHSAVKCENCPRLWQRDVNAARNIYSMSMMGIRQIRHPEVFFKGLCCFYHPRSSLYEPFSSQCPTSTILILKISDV